MMMIGFGNSWSDSWIRPIRSRLSVAAFENVSDPGFFSSLLIFFVKNPMAFVTADRSQKERRLRRRPRRVVSLAYAEHVR